MIHQCVVGEFKEEGGSFNFGLHGQQYFYFLGNLTINSIVIYSDLIKSNAFVLFTVYTAQLKPIQGIDV